MIILFRVMAAGLLVWLTVSHTAEAWRLFSSEGSAFMGYFRHSDAIHWNMAVALSCFLALCIALERWVKGK